MHYHDPAKKKAVAGLPDLVDRSVDIIGRSIGSYWDGRSIPTVLIALNKSAVVQNERDEILREVLNVEYSSDSRLRARTRRGGIQTYNGSTRRHFRADSARV